MKQTSSTFDFLDATFWRLCTAFACMLVVTAAMNVVVFPLFDGVFTFARDISQTVQALTILLIGVLATFRPAILKRVPLSGIALVGLVVGGVLLPASLAVGSTPLLIAGSSLFALARGCIMLSVAVAIARHLSTKAIVVCIALVYVASSAVQAFLWVMPIVAGFALYLLPPFVSLFLTHKDAMTMIALAVQGERPADAAITRPSSYLPLASQVFVCLFLFHLAFGFSLRFGESTGIPVETFFNIIPVGILAILLMRWGRFDADRLLQVSVLLVTVGFLFVNSNDGSVRNVSNILLSSGKTAFNMVSWIVIMSVGARNKVGALSVAGWGDGIGAIGTLVGAALGIGGNHLVEHSPTGLMVLTGVLLALFVGYALIGLKNFSFETAIEGIVPVEEPEVRSESPEDLFQARCDAIAEEYHLTPREREVFAMLARGRNREYIQEKLVVSRNTVKAHVRHVYEKLDIHSHQELIDLVEEGNLGAEFSGSSV